MDLSLKTVRLCRHRYFQPLCKSAENQNSLANTFQWPHIRFFFYLNFVQPLLIACLHFLIVHMMFLWFVCYLTSFVLYRNWPVVLHSHSNILYTQTLIYSSMEYIMEANIRDISTKYTSRWYETIQINFIPLDVRIASATIAMQFS